jgi:hypothetical protein
MKVSLNVCHSKVVLKKSLSGFATAVQVLSAFPVLGEKLSMLSNYHSSSLGIGPFV